MFPVRFTCDVEGEVSVLFAPESFGWLRPVIILLDVFFPLCGGGVIGPINSRACASASFSSCACWLSRFPCEYLFRVRESFYNRKVSVTSL
jgi:hypothetical protein